ncbi:MAG TPA: acyltransferase [Chitinophagaceae bacterium]|jgi:peptidoglycan/LPS O-acetylase OafA/YrhL|nr:acyltransferase [Chitinophagaceae bacterium]
MDLEKNIHDKKVIRLQVNAAQVNYTTTAKFYDQIDGLRCFCVLGVLLQHFVSHDITKYLYTANIGVDLFFLISGFLITEILINLKLKNTVGQALKIFYSRRILRIFPLYYLYWAILLLFFYNQVKGTVGWGLLYAYNFYNINNTEIPMAGHLWSLAVEEQFYMVWPLVLLLVPYKNLKMCLIGLLSASLIFLLFYFNPKTYQFTYYHTFACSVSLLSGALLAYLKKEHTQKLLNFLPKLSWTPLLGLIGSLAICYLVSKQTIGQGYLIFMRLFVCVAGFYVVGRMALKPFKGFAGKVFVNKAALFIGRISYGIYIYHLMVFLLLAPFINKAFEVIFNSSIFDNKILKYVKYNDTLFKFPVYTLIVIIVAAISYYLFEKRFLKLKKYFE